MSRLVIVLFLVLAMGTVNGCGSANPRGQQSAGIPAARRSGGARAATSAHSVVARRGQSLVATVRGSAIGLYRSPAAAHPYRTLPSRNPNKFRQVFLVDRARFGWLRVYLPLRPNRSTAWIRQRDVQLQSDPYLLRISLRRRELTLWRSAIQIGRTRVGLGRAVTPTPRGTYYLTEVYRLKNPAGPFGPYALGLSAFSDVLHEFAGGDGQIGIHGTNEPGGIGKEVSHGCVRVTNREITRLARLLPLGTPVRIVR